MFQLILAEKPSAAKSIASALNANERKGGFFMGGGYIVSYCAGHMLEMASPEAYGEQYAKWRYADLPIIPKEWLHIPSDSKSKQLELLKDLMNRPDVDQIINACDAGREGENIFRQVYEYANCEKKTQRLWVSSMEESAIKAAFDNLKDGSEYDSLYAAASCRERADWCVGINATRAFSCLYSGDTLNVGRVQSPTLAMLVRREADIATFVKEPFYTPIIDCGGFAASGERLKDLQAAEAIRTACDGKEAIVQSVERQTKAAAPPKLFDLTTLQREANRLFGFTAQETLDYAQSLYEKALLSYPRTDSKYLTADMHDTADAVIAWIQKDMDYKDGADFAPDVERLIDDGKVSDHHAIILTPAVMRADLSALPSGELLLLNLVACRLLCAAAPVHTYEAVNAAIGCAGYSFVAKGKTVVNEGWKEIDRIYRDSLKTKPEPEDSEDAASLPELSKGQVFIAVSATVKEGVTVPPKHYTEDTLLSAMDTAGADMPDDAQRRGLGTPATRAAIIEKIINSGFVRRQNKNLIPTEKGTNLIAVLPDELTSAKLTADWEHKLKQVERGELSGDDFMDDIVALTKAIIKGNSAPKPEFMGLFGGKNAMSDPLGVCPRCGSPVREGAKGFFCDNRACGFKMWKASKFWTSKKTPLTTDIVAALLKDGRIAIKGLN